MADLQTLMQLSDDEIRARLNELPSLYSLMCQLQDASYKQERRLCPLVADCLLSPPVTADKICLILVFGKRDPWGDILCSRHYNLTRVVDWHDVLLCAIQHEDFEAVMQLLRVSHLYHDAHMVSWVITVASFFGAWDLGRQLAAHFLHDGPWDGDVMHRFERLMAASFEEQVKQLLDHGRLNVNIIRTLDSCARQHLKDHGAFLDMVISLLYERDDTQTIHHLTEIFGMENSSTRDVYEVLLPGIRAKEGANEEEILMLCENLNLYREQTAIIRSFLTLRASGNYPRATECLQARIVPIVQDSWGRRRVGLIFTSALANEDYNLLRWLKSLAPSSVFTSVLEENLPRMLEMGITEELIVSAKESTKFRYAVLTRDQEAAQSFFVDPNFAMDNDITKIIQGDPSDFHPSLQSFYASLPRTELPMRYMKAFHRRDGTSMSIIGSLLGDLSAVLTADNFCNAIIDANPMLFDKIIAVFRDRGTEYAKLLKDNFCWLFDDLEGVTSTKLSRFERFERYLEELRFTGQLNKGFIVEQFRARSLEFRVEQLEILHREGLLDMPSLLEIVMTPPPPETAMIRKKDNDMVMASFLLSKGATMPASFCTGVGDACKKRLLREYGIPHTEFYTAPFPLENFFTAMGVLTASADDDIMIL